MSFGFNVWLNKDKILCQAGGVSWPCLPRNRGDKSSTGSMEKAIFMIDQGDSAQFYRFFNLFRLALLFSIQVLGTIVAGTKLKKL